MTPRVNDLVRGKYRIVRLIGDGGMGSVYEARHEGLGSPVALKFLHPDLARRPGLAQRFAREARVSAAIQSPHVTRVTDVDLTEDGTPYLVMELLNGRSLGALLDGPPEGRPSRDESVDFALQILLGLEAAHALGVVHRDLKPDNVFITTTPGGPVAKLIDFGIAKVKESGEYKQGLTFAGILMGTPEYMAPEQLFSANAA
jgi:serine/threonine protein kinase